MLRLEQLAVGTMVDGISNTGTVQIIAIKWYGDSVLELTFKDRSGSLANQLVYRDDEPNLEIVSNNLPWSFDGDAGKFKLVSEAYRINLAHLFDPYLAVHTSSIEPLPHQISAVYEEMLNKMPLRFILADDPGAGKTIMTGLLLRELMIRGDLKRCLIVSPGSLSEQWQDELLFKFNLRFEILTNDRIESSISGNIFNEINYCIVRLDKLARNETLREKLKNTDWDLIVVDEAHKMSATVWGGEVKYTARFRLGQLLSSITRHFLLLTATPHNGKEADFELFLSLIDQDRFEGVNHTSNKSIDVSDIMRRLVKEELLKFDGTPLFPERRAYTVNYDLSPQESILYNNVTEYVRDEFNRADQLEKGHKSTVGFALTILQRRLASSPEAIYQSLRRRRERLENRLAEERIGKRAASYNPNVYFEDYDTDDFSADEIEKQEEQIADQASASKTISELEAEINTLKKLENLANQVRTSGTDRKWDELSKLLQDNENMCNEDGNREKIIIFTEHRDTLRYLYDKITSLLGNENAVVTIHGGMLRDDRRKVEALFKQDKDVRVLIATDAAGEGINLQRAHLMVNYDLPWNPNRLEQRFGRIHRIGQTEVCHLWNLVSKDTREGAVFQRLFEKLEEERAALGGKVFDILGKMSFDNKPLRELLVEAIRYGEDPKVKARLQQVVDDSLDIQKVRDLLEEYALIQDSMDVSKVMKIKEEMERAEAHKLQPFFIESFFKEAFKTIGGKINKREHGRYEITHVPVAVRDRDRLIGFGNPVLKKYERVCFDKANVNVQGMPQADLLCPGHPLLEAVIDLVVERSREAMKHGTILIDEQDYGMEPRLLFYIEDSIQDNVILSNGGKRVISKHIHFVEIKENGSAINAGYAPYLDYRIPTENEMPILHNFVMSQNWLTQDVEDKAKIFAISNIIPKHFQEIKQKKLEQLDKIERAVKSRLTVQINYWDSRAAELKQKENAGKINAKLNSDNALRRAEELTVRLQQRLAEIAKEKMISSAPPVISGGAVIIPLGLLKSLIPESVPNTFGNGDRKAVEFAAMKAVTDIETELGYIPTDVSSENCGYDIESTIPEEMQTSGSRLRFIEVKGRTAGAKTVTVTNNEIITGLNKPDEYILAIVEVDGDHTHTIYLQHPFENRPDWASNCVTYDINNLIQRSKVLLER